MTIIGSIVQRASGVNGDALGQSSRKIMVNLSPQLWEFVAILAVC